MTTTELARSSIEDRGSGRAEPGAVVACGFCRKRLANEFFFTCLKCGLSYCYIHIARHQPVVCSRRVRRNSRDEAEWERQRGERASAKGDFPLLLASEAE